MMQTWQVESIRINNVDSTEYFEFKYLVPSKNRGMNTLIFPKRKGIKGKQGYYGWWKYERSNISNGDFKIIDSLDGTFTGTYVYKIIGQGKKKLSSFKSDRIELICREMNFSEGNSVPLTFD